MGFLIALFLFVSTFGSVHHYMQAVAIAQEMYSWDHPTTEIDDVTGYDDDDHDDDDDDGLPESIAREEYYVIYAGDNEGLHMTVLLMFYSPQGFIEGGYTFLFTRP